MQRKDKKERNSTQEKHETHLN